MNETRVIHVSEMANFQDAVYIGREYRKRGHILAESPLRNPFVIKAGCPRRAVIDDYRWMAAGRLRIAEDGGDIGIAFVKALIGARGKPIACWCRHDGDTPNPGNACHGDVIIELLERYTDDDLRAMMHTPVE